MTSTPTDTAFPAETEGEYTLAAGRIRKAMPLCDQLRIVHRTYCKALQNRIAAHGVSLGQWAFLCSLWEEDGITQRELSRRVGMKEPTTVSALNVMERQGIVIRVRNTFDKRKINVFLTEKARKMRDSLLKVSADIERQARQSITDDDMEKLNNLLSRIVSNLNGRATS
ncbi:MAG: MarR family winged helix-turn-helix transcriptional regulator [Pseudomonadota bacterium]|nr:MarR family winged helix-turn-helix transcriptional regulator [Pseudomonadota bacterium]